MGAKRNQHGYQPPGHPNKSLISLNLPRFLLEQADNLIDKGVFQDRSELFRAAVRDLIFKHNPESLIVQSCKTESIIVQGQDNKYSIKNQALYKDVEWSRSKRLCPKCSSILIKDTATRYLKCKLCDSYFKKTKGKGLQEVEIAIVS
jgi:Arc/MetJ-type ribon-helix-helix transcriptional regulator/DNA-directed RNA polymerase subunit RPC12/RpoP